MATCMSPRYSAEERQHVEGERTAAAAAEAETRPGAGRDPDEPPCLGDSWWCLDRTMETEIEFRGCNEIQKLKLKKATWTGGTKQDMTSQ